MSGRSFINLFSATLVFALSTACAGPQLERLDGEPKSVWPLTAPRSQRTAPAVDGLQRFIRAMDDGAIEAAYLLLSAETRADLQKRAAVMGKRGFDLLRKPADGMSPGERALHIPDPVAKFAMHGATAMTAGPAPYPSHVPADGRTIEQTVQLVDAGGQKKVVTMRFEGLHWRVHQPDKGSPAPAGP